MGRTSSATPTTIFPRLSLACKQPNTKPKHWTTGSEHQLWATTSEMYDIHGWVYEEIFEFDRRNSSGCGRTPPAVPFSAHPPAKPISNKPEGKHRIFSPFAKSADARSYEGAAPCRRNADDRADRCKIAKKLWDLITADHNVLVKTKSRDCITDMQWSCKIWRINGFNVIHAKPNQLKISDNVTSRRNPKIHFYGQCCGIN